MTMEAKFRVALDTTGAHQQMQQLVRRGEATGAQLSKKLGRALWGNTGAAAFGAASGATRQAVQAPTSAGITDLVGESMAGFGSVLNDFFLGKADDRARAMRQARDETAEAFKMVVREDQPLPDGVREFYQSRLKLRTQEEIGRSEIQKALSGGTEIEGLINRIVTGLGEEIDKAVDKLLENIPFFGR